MKKITRTEAKRIWIKIVDENVSPLWHGISMETQIKKLKRIQFNPDGTMCENKIHAWVLKSYGSLVKIYDRILKERKVK